MIIKWYQNNAINVVFTFIYEAKEKEVVQSDAFMYSTLETE